MWEESTRAVVAVRVVVLMALAAILTVVALHGQEWGPVAAAPVVESESAATLLENLPLQFM